MIIDRLLLNNFGLFRDKHEIVLTPPSARKPITLIGGLNGRGKTTFLDAIQLALYGKFARCSNRGSLGYQQYQKACIHRGESSAAVELHFRSTSEGREERFSIRRSWNSTPSSFEKIRIYRDEVRDPLLEENWDEYVDRFLPVGIAPLFFFDGEKIEQLADPQTSKEVLTTAVNALLGVDLIKQLADDLTSLERRKRAELVDDPDTERLNDLESKIRELAIQRDGAEFDRNEADARLKNARDSFRQADQRFRTEGGELYQKKFEVESLTNETEAKLASTRRDLIEVAEDLAPLLLVEELLTSTQQRDEAEQVALNNAVVEAMLLERDEQTVSFFSETISDSDTQISALRKFLFEDRRSRIETTSTDIDLNLSESTRRFINSFSKDAAPQLRARIKSLLEEESRHRETLTSLERKQSTIPAQDAIAELTEMRDEEKQKADACQSRLSETEEAIERMDRGMDELTRERQKILETDVSHRFAQDGSRRVVEHSQKTRILLKSFRTKLIQKNSERIASLVLECFQQLIGKSELISSLRVDSETLEVTLIDSTGTEIPSERLSAGERQLLAVALLWGLARLSGRPLPTVIDTPLGRLDSSHRENLIQRYFPNASHQVILLSTDEEVNQTYHPMLKRSVGRSYLLEYDQETRSTQIRTGYFW